MAVSQKELEEVQRLTARLREIVELGEGQLAEREPNFKALNDRLDTLEAKTNRPALFGDSSGEIMDLDEAREKRERTVKAKTYRKAFGTYLRKGFERMPKSQREAMIPTEKGEEGWNFKSLDLKALNLTDDTLGGFFVLPEIVQDEILRNIVLISPVRGIMRVRQTSSNNLKIPVLTQPTAAAWISETGTRTVSANPQFGMKDIPTHEMYALMLYSRQMVEDAFFDIEKELQFEYSQQFAKLEGAAFVSGSGVGQPLGFLNDGGIANFTTAASGVLAPDDLINAVHNFPSFAYYMAQAKWVMNLATLGVIRKMKDTQNRYLWEPGLSQADPPMILNMPYVIAPDMPNVASGALAVAFGDFQRGYSIVDRTQIAVQRLEELYATSAQIGVLAYKRVGGQTVLSEAIHGVKVQ